MKLDKLNLDGKKNSIEVWDKVFSVKMNKRLIKFVLLGSFNKKDYLWMQE